MTNIFTNSINNIIEFFLIARNIAVTAFKASIFTIIMGLHVLISIIENVINFFAAMLAKLLFVPLMLINYGIIKSISFIIKRPYLNFLNLNVSTLSKFKNFLKYELLFTEILIIFSVGFMTGVLPALLVTVLPEVSIILTFSILYVVTFSALSIGINIIRKFTVEFESLKERIDNEIDNIVIYFTENLNQSLTVAAESLQIKSLLQCLEQISDANAGSYFWSAQFEEKANNLAEYSCGIWQNLHPTVLKAIEDRFTILNSVVSLALKSIPVKVMVRNVRYQNLFEQEEHETEYTEDLLHLLHRLHLEEGVLRERGNVRIKYSDIRLDHDSINLINKIKSKAADVQSDEFNTICDLAVVNNNFAELLKFLQKAELKHDVILGVLYWNDKLQEVMDKFDANALSGPAYPREHKCNRTLKVLQNPCYIVKPDDPSQRTYYEFIEILNWVVAHNQFPQEQNDEDVRETTAAPAADFLLSKIHYDTELKEALNATYYQENTLTMLFGSGTVAPTISANTVISTFRALNHTL